MKIISDSMLEPDQDAPKIEFPCDYPIKVLGEQSDDFEQQILSVFGRHAPGLDPARVTSKQSSKGRFVSVTVVIVATGEQQLAALFDDLKRLPAVKMVL